jgi:hypothetical protein
MRIHTLAEENPLPKHFVPGQGQVRAHKAIAEGRSVKFNHARYVLCCRQTLPYRITEGLPVNRGESSGCLLRFTTTNDAEIYLGRVPMPWTY